MTVLGMRGFLVARLKSVPALAQSALACLLPLALALWTGLRFPPMYDEWAHQAFSQHLSEHAALSTIATYEGSKNYEAKGPLYFLLAALWGQLAGFDLFQLRLLTLAFSVLCILAFHRFFGSLVLQTDGRVGWSLPCLPYFLPLSLTFMTDVPSLSFLMLSLLAYFSYLGSKQGQHLIWGALFLACAAYIRVELLYVLLAMAFAAWRHGALDRRLAFYLFLPALLRLPLVILWGGLAAPPAQARPHAVALAFQPAHIVFALSVLGLYFWPLLLGRIATNLPRITKPKLVSFLFIAGLCIAFPPLLVAGDVDRYGGTIRSLVLAGHLAGYSRVFVWLVLAMLGLAVSWSAVSAEGLQGGIIGSALRALCMVGLLMQAFRGAVFYERYLLEITPFFLLLLAPAVRSGGALFGWAVWSLGLQLTQMLKNGIL